MTVHRFVAELEAAVFSRPHGVVRAVGRGRIDATGPCAAIGDLCEIGDDDTPLVAEIVKFLQTGVAPVSAEETIEMFAYMAAADESKHRGGAPVKLSEVLEAAKK